MQKVKIILVNLILFLILFHVADFCCTVIDYNYAWFYENYNGIKLVKYIKDYRMIHKYSIKFDEKLANELILTDKYCNRNDASPKWGAYRPIENKDAKNAILIFGCSFAYGLNLTNQETFSYNLGKYLPNYKIYNRAQGCLSTTHMLYQLQNKDFEDIKNLKYVIYVFIDDHIYRNYNSYLGMIIPYYKITKSGEVKLQKYSIKYVIFPLLLLKRTVVCEILRHNLYYKNINANKINKDAVTLTKNLILASKNTLNSKNREVKFIVLRYDRNEKDPYNYMFEELKKEDVTVLSVNELSNKDYLAPAYHYSDWHPKPKVWREITPLFVKYMQDRGYLKD